MQFEVFTLLPEVFPSYLETSILKRARERGLIQVNVHNIREYARDKHHTTDDQPYGGGGGMVMKPEPVFEALETILAPLSPPEPDSTIPIILLTPQGRTFNQATAKELAQYPRLALICGRYEGVDERIRRRLVSDEISIGDYVLTGGELPALILIDAVARLLPNVLGDPTGAEDDSHAMGLLEYPHYTRPPVFRGDSVPEELLSGDHKRIDRWRRERALERTFRKRPDMLARADLSDADRKFIESLKNL